MRLTSKALRVVILFSLFNIFSQKVINAAPFSQACGDGIGDSRPLCNPIPKEKFDPNSYSQVPILEDCSNYCFGGHEISFSSEPIINSIASVKSFNCRSMKPSKLKRRRELASRESPA
jgi:hypothetical protein